LTTVTIKGQVTIPKAVRDLLGIKPGNAVSFDMAPDGQVVITKAGARGGRRRRGSIWSLCHAPPSFWRER
jgi:AbrB family looped-hinge helix DNA binding protein